MLYLPLRFCEKVDNGIIVNGHPELRNRMNGLARTWVNKQLAEDRKRFFFLSCVAYRDNVYLEDEVVQVDVKQLVNKYINFTNCMAECCGDCANDWFNRIIVKDWGDMKKVYKVEKSMLYTLIDMDVPADVPAYVVTKTPSKCFYVDFGDEAPFCDYSPGMFVTTDMYEGIVCFTVHSLIEVNGRCSSLVTCFCVNTGIEDEEEFDDNELVSFNFDGFNESVTVDNELGIDVTIKEKSLIKFLTNLLIYFHVANRDVEYTERTKQVYKPRNPKKAPTNKVREIEEFGVGFKNASPISASKVRKVYVDEDGKPVDMEQVGTKEKRKYSSNYRSAHWHRYWKNGENGKEVILKWIPTTFVHGNYQDDRVTVHNVIK